MSQVQIKKYESGGSSEKPQVRTIKRGNDDIDLDKYIRNLEHNFDSWLDSRKMNDKEKSAVREAYRDMLNGYNSGEMTAQLGNRSHDSTGRRKNAESGFDAYGAAQDYFNTILQYQSVYNKPTKAKFDKRKSWNDYLGKQEIDYDLFKSMNQDEQNSFLQNLLNDYVGNIKGDDYEDYDQNYGQSVIDLFNQAISDPELTAKERMDLSQVGINLSNFFNNPDSEKSELEKSQEEYQKALEEAQIQDYGKQTDLIRLRNNYMQLQEDPNLSFDLNRFQIPYVKELDFSKMEKTRKEVLQNIFNDLENFFRTNNIYEKSEEWWNDKNGLGIRNWKWTDSKGNEQYEFDPNWSNGQTLRYLMDLYNKHHLDFDKGPMPTTAQGHHIMNTDKGYARVYDPKTHRIYNVPVAKIPGLMDVLPEFTEYNPIQSNKQGGILKAQFGMTFDDLKSGDQIKQERLNEIQKAKEDALNEAVRNSGKTKEEYLASQRDLGDGLTSIDKARMASIAVDLGSALASFTGVGSVAGGIGGLAGTALSTYADIKDDAVSKTDVIKNLALGLGLSAIGLIPVAGGAGKAISGITKAIKYIPKILLAVSAGTIMLDDDVQKSLSKFSSLNLDGITNPTEFFKKNKITNDDLRNLTMAIGAAAGITRMGNNSIKKRIVKRNVVPGETKTDYKIKVKTPNGTTKDVQLTAEQYTAMKEASSSAEEATRLLRSIRGQENNSVISSRKYGLFGSKQLKNSSLSSETTSSNYVLDPNYRQTRLGKLYLGEADVDGSDINLIMRQLNNTYDLFRNGIFFRRNPSQPTTSQTTPQQSIIRGLLPAHVTNTSRQSTPVATSVNPISNPIPNPVPNPIRPSQPLMLNMPRRFQLSDGRIAENLKYRGQQLDANNINQLINSGKFKFMDKQEIRNLIPGASNGLVSLENPDRIYFWKQGGQLKKKFDIGGSITNTSHNNGYSWDDIIYNTDYFRKVLQGINKDNYLAANALQNRYYTDKINQDWDNSSTTYRDSVRKYQTDFNTAYGTNLNSGAIEDAINKGLIQRTGTSGDNANGQYADGYTGAMTNLRHLGTRDHAKYIEAMNQILNQNELEAYVNEYGMINYRPMTKQQDTTQQTDNQTSNDLTSDNITSNDESSNSHVDVSKTEEKTSSRNIYDGILRTLYPKILGNERLIGTLRANKNIYNTMRSAIRPDLLNTYELYSPVTGAFATNQFYDSKAADTRFLANTPLTSDASLHASRQFEGNRQAMDLERQGHLADNQEIQRTKAEALKRQEDNIARRTDIANKNRSSINNTIRTLAQLKSDYLLKDWNAKANWLTEKQQDANAELERYRNFVLTSEEARAKQQYQDEIAFAYQELQNDINAHKNDPNWDYTQSDKYEQYQKKVAEAQNNRRNYLYNTMSSLYGYSFNPISRSWIHNMYNEQ